MSIQRAALLVLLGCGSGEIAVDDRDSTARFACDFHLDPDPPPVGELFAVLVEVREGDEPVNDADVEIDATMPDHGHGMLTAPQTAQVGDGVYRAQGMKLHMAGAWELAAHIRRADREETCRAVWQQPVQPSR